MKEIGLITEVDDGVYNDEDMKYCFNNEMYDELALKDCLLDFTRF